MPSIKQNDEALMILGAAILAAGVIIGTTISIIAVATTLPDTIIMREETGEATDLSAPKPSPVIAPIDNGVKVQTKDGDKLSDPDLLKQRQ